MNCFWGKMLVADLTNNTIEAKPIPKEWGDMYLGQKGLGTRIFMENVLPDVEPLSPDNELVFTSAIMTGTIVSSAAKLAITTKSPLTNTISDGSVGGHSSAELKYAGYDALVVKGKADTLKYIYITPEKAEIRDAENLRGIGTFDTDRIIKEKCNDEEMKVLAIGEAGENMVSYSCVSAERYRQLGRGGIGAVFGSKNLKAVAIRGWLDIEVADMDKCLKVAAEAHKSDGIFENSYEMYEFGTPVLVDFSQESGLFPTKNFQKGQFEHAKNFNGITLKGLRQNKKACFACGIACGNYVKAGKARVEGPEYETIALCGGSIMNDSAEKLVQFNAVCDDLGMDTISAGGVIAYMMEATEKGVKDFGINFGEIDKALDLLPKIAKRQGIGAEAALGTKKLSEKYGGKDFAIHVKGMELPGYDPRGSWGMGLAYATAPRGGCHMTAYTVEQEAWGDLDPFTFKGKAQLVADAQNDQFAKFSMGICDFWPVSNETLAELFEVTYGGKWTTEMITKAGERIFNLQRMYNIMIGFDRKEDTLPKRFFKEVLKAGPPKDIQMTEESFNKTLNEYYKYRGWDEHGRPTIEKLQELEVEPPLIDEYKKAIS